MSFEYIKTRAVLVESKFKAKPGELFINGMFKLCAYHSTNEENKFYNAQYLYLVDKSKIHAGDWYLMNFDRNDWELMECRDDEEADRCNNHFSIAPSCFKIISTNNKEIPVPQVPEKFLSHYMKTYNSGCAIKDVYLDTAPDYSEVPEDAGSTWRAYINYKLKIDENNFVSVKPTQ